MKNTLVNFWCSHLYPFCGIKNVKPDFKINGREFNKINLSENEHILNQSTRRNNLKELEKKGGIKKYLFNWLAISLLSIVVVFALIEPQSFSAKLIISLLLFLPSFGVTAIMFIFLYILKIEVD